MNVTGILIKRNIKLFFKDKGMFFTSLITPMILLVLYATFLGNVYKDSLLSSIPKGIEIADKIVNGYVGGQLISSILAVSCVTVAFCSNMLMVQDRANGSIKDLYVSPVNKTSLAFSYYIASLTSTFIICFAAALVCLIYIAVIGWYLTISDVLFILLDVFLLVMFGTALSSVINFFLSTQGQISAVGSIVSSAYGFICGAYMPISQFSDSLQNIVKFLPGTYGTSLLRNHSMSGVFGELEKTGVPNEVIDIMKNVVDCNIEFFDREVTIPNMYLILSVAVIVLILVYVLLNKKCLSVKSNK